MGEAIQALDARDRRAPRPCAGRRARASSASWCAWRATRPPGIARALHVADAAMTVLAAHDDAYGQCRAWSLRAQAGWFAGTVGRADAAWEEAARFAEEVEDERELVQILGWRATAAVLGPTPVADAIRQCERSASASAQARSRWP